MKPTNFVKYIFAKLENKTMDEARLMFRALGFKSSSGSYKTTYFKKGCEFVFKVMNKDGMFVKEILKDPNYLKRELCLNEFSSKFRVPVLARMENDSFFVLVQEKVVPVWEYSDYDEKCDPKISLKHTNQMKRLIKKARRSFERDQLKEGVDYFNDMNGNAGFDRNGNLLCFDGI